MTRINSAAFERYLARVRSQIKKERALTEQREQQELNREMLLALLIALALFGLLLIDADEIRHGRQPMLFGPGAVFSWETR